MAADTSPTIVWLRDDLRVADNPALNAAVERGGDVVVLYVLDDESDEVRPIGAASRWWLHHSLTALAADLDALGASLTLRRGPAERVVMGVVDEVGAGTVHWNRRYGRARDVDARLKAALKDRDIEAVSHAANLLFEPWTVQTGSGGPYGVFTPFWKSCLARDEPRAPLEAPASIPGLAVDGDDLDDWELLPTAPDWAGGMRDEWTPGSAGGRERLEHMDGRVVDDGVDRVQAQTVDVEVDEPEPGVVDDPGAHLVAVRAVDVDPLAPVRGVSIGEVGPERRQVVSRGAEMVVDDVEDHAETATMAGIDETGEAFRPSIGVVRRVEVDAVVAPAAVAGELGHGQHLDRIDAQIDQRVEVLDRAVERAGGREGADVDLFEHRGRQVESGPGLI